MNKKILLLLGGGGILILVVLFLVILVIGVILWSSSSSSSTATTKQSSSTVTTMPVTTTTMTPIDVTNEFEVEWCETSIDSLNRQTFYEKYKGKYIRLKGKVGSVTDKKEIELITEL